MKFIFELYGRLTSILEKGTWLPLLLARLSVGSVFVVSGWGKLHNIPKVVAYFTDLGIPMPEVQARFVAMTEFSCGSLILIGLLTRLASVPLTITMIVAILTAKMGDIGGVSDLLGLDEFLYIVFFVLLIIRGAGPISVDAVLSRLCRDKKHGGGDLVLGRQ